MKRIGYLYDKAFSKETIRKAINEAARNKRHRRQVRHILANADKFVDIVYEMMQNRAFVPSAYTKDTTSDPIKKKVRNIFKPRFFPDQIIHWCIYIVIRDDIYKSLIKQTCASIKGRGQLYGIKIVQKWMKNDRKGTKYYLKIDIHHYYPSVNNDTLISFLERKIKDKEFLELIKNILILEPGLPIGMLLSQIFANFYLSNFDHKVLEQKDVEHYIRYNDDIVAFSSNKKKLHKLRKDFVQMLGELDLQMKPNWQVCKTDSEPLDFMGYRINHEKLIIRKKVMYRVTARGRRFYKNPNFHNASAVVSDFGWIKHTMSWNLFDKWLRPYVNYKKAKNIIRRKQKNVKNISK